MDELIQEIISFVFNLVLSAVLMPVGYFFGKRDEKKHYRSIIEREKKYCHILLFNEKRPPVLVAGQPFALVHGSAVISGDHFKQVVAMLKNLLGGRLTTYETMLDRGRREAILRMKEKADAMGATMIFNVSMQTTTLGQKTGKHGLACAEIMAYGTAWRAPS